jgi:hypothetical protein
MRMNGNGGRLFHPISWQGPLFFKKKEIWVKLQEK